MKKVVIGLVIVIVVLGSCGFYFFGGKNSTYDLTEKFGLTGDVVDYGIYEDGKESSDLMESFNDAYIQGLEKGEKVYLVYGDENEVFLATYEDILNGNIQLIIGENNFKLNLEKKKYALQRVIPVNNKISVLINGEAHEFKIKPNENIYLIVSG